MTLTSLFACAPGAPGASDSGSIAPSTSDATAASTTSVESTSSAGSDSSEPSSSTATSDGTSSTGGEFPAECDSADPAVAAMFELQIVDWPDNALVPPGVPCTVDGVTSEVTMVATALTCDVEGVTLPAIVAISAAPEGQVAWVTGDAVILQYGDFGTESGQVHYLQLRDADDDSALLYAAKSSYHHNVGTDIEPVSYELLQACGVDGYRPALLRFALHDAQVEIFSGHRGSLAIDGSDAYAIDVGEALTSDLHKNASLHLLLRRVVIGE
ncbi:hypothetical protein OV090_11655 [Nannocystis sp. RBIL2]|uniref:hypothetical protein n=1 Tax=Nannocystis sp. RBIL2 TaxID=2996788 RepID=UPI00226E7466|nr:hypothetical protein [Nannocystis sp. RBIL2]MCY1065423.1 hypothetical protein [Nannocystis sp. RBIL2]